MESLLSCRTLWKGCVTIGGAAKGGGSAGTMTGRPWWSVTIMLGGALMQAAASIVAWVAVPRSTDLAACARKAASSPPRSAFDKTSIAASQNAVLCGLGGWGNGGMKSSTVSLKYGGM